ncbi:glycosyl hydrolase-like protein [Eremomyces bilateralis CBS 781.70]|uniref:Glycosyl hydrolase-like protein n=1 Tax=Eremomyces bilateralis CBS 781.70 TaxID=1392243 RepID=A0A6G1FZ87_9PEZI|nr:glycosyl hydrolase-like protein [Eremomyces bilateralis CBS 781.70]KAF1811185.1 glycosyl hydrolase-like protein [Eremomyces bilateralis CBS 781.70]
MASFKLQIDGTRFCDSNGREVILHGINVSGDCKLPTTPYVPSHQLEHFFDGDNVSFVGRPFSLSDAHTHFARLKRFGYNTIRYLFTWEALEHAGPGRYDEEYIAYTIEVLRLAKEYGFYVFMDPHQDVWSRFSGGSGSPMWTIYACGLDPQKFAATEAAIVHNTHPDPENFPKMVWSTNYHRLACQTMFTMFFAGKTFTPLAIIDGKNIQDYLQDHFVNACQQLAKRMKEAGGLDHVIGWESWNEPNRGIIGWQDLTVIPTEQKLQKGTSPTAWQAMLLGSGRACEIDIWDMGGLGPYKSGSTLVDPKGEIAWLSDDYDDTQYGWKRDPGWKMGECIWAQCGVWDPSTDALLNKDYFAKDPETGETIDYEYFTNRYFMAHYRRYRDMVRKLFPETIMFCQPPVLEIPPSIKGTSDDDPNMVFAPHFYDGITLMTKKWNRVWNVDVFGILRGKYLHPALGIKIGETAIRNCFRDQLSAIRQEGMDNMGERPCVFTEIGIPYDMDDKHAYKTGDFSSQISALDANMFAVEGCGAAGFAYWVYAPRSVRSRLQTNKVSQNDHKWGDQWNGEDLSILSTEDKILPERAMSNLSQVSLNRNSLSYSESLASSESSGVTPRNLKQTLSANTDPGQSQMSQKPLDNVGYRAAEAFVRPYPIVTHSQIVSYGFDLKSCTFSLTLDAPSATSDDLPTELFLPEFHFPSSVTQIEASGGKWTVSLDDENGVVVQRLKWWHAEGEQTVTIKGIKRKAGTYLAADDEEEGYLGQCSDQGKNCVVM